MRCLPVIDRELRVSARRPGIYRQRLGAAALANGVVVLFTLFGPVLSATYGHWLFTVLATGGFVVCLLIGLNETAESLSYERREGTLGLLFLTDLRGSDVVLGKLSAASIRSFTTVFAIIPAFMLPLWLGGVTLGETWRVAASLVMALIVSMTIGMFVSSVSRSALASVAGSILLITLVMLLPGASIFLKRGLPEWTAGPFAMLCYSYDVAFKASSFMFYLAWIYSGILAAGMFLLACSLAGQLTKERTAKIRTLLDKFFQPTPGYTNTWTGRTEPSIWLAEHGLAGRKVLWLLISIAMLVSFLVGCFVRTNVTIILLGIQLFFVFFIKLWIAVLAVQPFNVARKTGALELLLCTPLKADQLVRAHVEAMRGYFLAPSIMSSFGIIGVGAIANNLLIQHDQTYFLGIAAVTGFACFISFLLDLHAVVYVGLWHGLEETHIPQGVGKTVLKVLILPWLLVAVPHINILAFFAIPWMFMDLAKSRLTKRFQQVVTDTAHHRETVRATG